MQQEHDTSSVRHIRRCTRMCCDFVVFCIPRKLFKLNGLTTNKKGPSQTSRGPMTPGRAHPSCARLVSRKEYRRFMRLRSRAPTTFPWAGRWLASGSGWRRRQRAGGPPSRRPHRHKRVRRQKRIRRWRRHQRVGGGGGSGWRRRQRPTASTALSPANTNSPTRGRMICRDDTPAPTPDSDDTNIVELRDILGSSPESS